MLKSPWALGAICLVILCLGACSSQDDNATFEPDGGAGNGGSAGMSGAHTIEFTHKNTLELEPLQKIELTVQARPATSYVVRFSLNGDSLDGSLTATEVNTGADGRATTTLYAPSQTASFSVRASVGTDVSTALAVSVSGSGFGSIQVLPSYFGKRPITSWTASVHPGKRCADLSGAPYQDGALWANSIPEEIILIGSVPAGVISAVTLRASQIAGGCSDITPLVAKETRQAQVQAINRPIRLSETDLDLSLSFDAENSTWQNTLSSVASAQEAAFVGSAENDISALLDAMAQTFSTADTPTFEAARSQYAWDQALSNWAGANSAEWLRSYLREFSTLAQESAASDALLKGRLSSQGSGEFAYWKLSSVGGAKPDAAGFPTQLIELGISADPDDSLLLGGGFHIKLGGLVFALTEQAARAEFPGSSSLYQALSQALSCQDMVAELLTDEQLFDGCDLYCGKTACEEGLKRLTERMLGVNPAHPFRFSAVASTEIDSEARLTGFLGTWVGELDTSDTDNNSSGEKYTLSGEAQGSRPTSAP